MGTWGHGEGHRGHRDMGKVIGGHGDMGKVIGGHGDMGTWGRS